MPVLRKVAGGNQTLFAPGCLERGVHRFSVRNEIRPGISSVLSLRTVKRANAPRYSFPRASIGGSTDPSLALRAPSPLPKGRGIGWTRARLDVSGVYSFNRWPVALVSTGNKTAR